MRTSREHVSTAFISSRVSLPLSSTGVSRSAPTLRFTTLRMGLISTDSSPVAVALGKLGALAVGLELAESMRRLEAVQPRRQAAGERAERRYVDGRGRLDHSGVALPTMLVRGLVPRHSRGTSESDLSSRVQ